MDDDRIIQIIPANNIMTCYYIEDDNNGHIYRTPVQLIALKKSGEIMLMDFDSDGFSDCPDECGNFLGYEFNGEIRSWVEAIEYLKKKRSNKK